ECRRLDCRKNLKKAKLDTCVGPVIREFPLYNSRRCSAMYRIPGRKIFKNKGPVPHLHNIDMDLKLHVQHKSGR
ncbi:hypothetical protein HAX54_039411, partial [Datura stramonium]|nr:hypothetical protein [Datura stramonium]